MVLTYFQGDLSVSALGFPEVSSPLFTFLVIIVIVIIIIMIIIIIIVIILCKLM